MSERKKIAVYVVTAEMFVPTPGGASDTAQKKTSVRVDIAKFFSVTDAKKHMPVATSGLWDPKLEPRHEWLDEQHPAHTLPPPEGGQAAAR